MKNHKILVLCTGNSCRSQIAEGFLKHYCKINNWQAEIYSAGIKAEGVNPLAIQTMKELGIDISHHTSNKIEDFSELTFTHILTVCDHANESCPVILKKSNHTHHNFTDPSKIRGSNDYIEHCFRLCREEIKKFVLEYLTSNFTTNQK